MNLKEIINKYPNCLASTSVFKATLGDLFPNEKRTINILSVLIECGAVHRIKSFSVIGDNEINILLKMVENAYGISAEYALEPIKMWADFYNIRLNISKNKPESHVSEIPAPVEYKQVVNNVIVNGTESDFEVSEENGYLTITKFLGFDEDKIVIPNMINGKPVKRIGDSAFENCTGIKEVVISEGIKEIGESAFSGCSSLTNIKLPSTLKRIGNKAFCNCRKLKEVVISEEIIEIGRSAFSSCISLVNVKLPSTLKKIEDRVFCDCKGIKEVVISEGITYIGIRAFNNCSSLTNIVFPSTLKRIEDVAFADCWKLRSILIPKSVEEIASNAFSGTSPTILCYAGSYALEYARKRGLKVQNAGK